MFKRYVIRWMARPQLRRQLPFSYRAFAAYAWLTLKTSNATALPRGYEAFQLARRLAGSAGEKGLMILTLPGLKACVDLHDPRFLNVVRVLVERTALEREYARLIGPGDTFVDIGANHGECSLIAARLVGRSGLVVSVEPQPRLAAALSCSMARNAFAPHRVHTVAVGDRDGVATLFIPAFSSGSAGFFPSYSAEGAHRRHDVLVRRFDELDPWEEYPGRVLLKVDIEGSEIAFLHGAARFIRQRRPALIVEIHPGTLRAAGADGATLIHTLASLGYATYRESGDTTLLPLTALDTARQRNVVVFPEE